MADSAAYLVELEAGSDEERRWRGEWLSRLMFGWMVGQSDPGQREINEAQRLRQERSK